LPAATSCITAVAVMLLLVDPMTTGVRSVIFLPSDATP
jgi:hypothetical protein